MYRIILLLAIFLFQFAFAAVDYEQLKAQRAECYKIQTSACFLKLYNQYSLAASGWRNILYFDYAQMLLAEKDYAKAQEAFKTVLRKENNNKELISATQKKLNEINELYEKISTANNLDAGDYFDKTKEKLIWQNPYNIKVYIASSTGKEDILKRAFGIWDDKLYKSINFSYVSEENKADIIIKYVDTLSGSQAGITKYSQVWNAGNKKYLKKVNVEIALKNPNGGSYTDTNLLAIALHEIAHALGINYHSDNLNDILYYSTETYKNGSVSRRDVNTVQRLYR